MPTVPDVGVGVRIPRGALFLAGFLIGGGAPVRAQEYMGPSKCVGCHDHDRQATKWNKEEPAAFKGKAHFLTLKQLETPQSAQWAKAVGLADVYDLKGSCVRCHATVYKGDASAGVSCESCHGPSSKYNDIHQKPGAYPESVKAGLKDLKEKPDTIAKLCVECHILRDPKLVAAGHPAGKDFDAGVSLQKLVHWKRTYDYAKITAAAKAAGGSIPVGTTAGKVSPPPTTGPKPPVPSATPRPSTGGADAGGDWTADVKPLPDTYGTGPDVPATPAPPPTMPPPPSTLSPPASPAPPPPPRPAAAEAVALRGESVTLLEKLLRAGKRTPNANPPANPSEYSGPDGELLRLQDEVIALALEALRRPP
jgi:hypothetical protein